MVHLGAQFVALFAQFGGLGLDLDTAQDPRGALNGGKGEIEAQREGQHDEDRGADRKSL